MNFSQRAEDPRIIPGAVGNSSTYERAEFIRKTYNHLAFALLGFGLLEALLLNLPFTESIIRLMLGGRFSWLIVLGAFMLVSYIANEWALSGASKDKQYMGLTLYVIAEAIIFLPLLYIAERVAPGAITSAGVLTLVLFTGLTFYAFSSKKDFSFLNGFLTIGGFVAMGIILCSIFFGFQLGIIFSGGMVIFAGAAILRDTSNIIYHYRSDQYVAASLSLFASVALMFWYILRILIALSGRD